MTDPSPIGHPVDVVAIARPPEPRPIDPLLPPAAASDTHNVEAVFNLYFDFVWRSLRRLGVAEGQVDDATQDVFLVVHRHFGEFEGRSSVKTWLFAIARRVAHDYRRRRARKGGGEPLSDALPDRLAPTPLEAAQRSEAGRILHELLEELDEERRAIFVLAELEQLSVPEIADALGVKLNTVYSRLRLARRDFDAAVARRLAGEGQT